MRRADNFVVDHIANDHYNNRGDRRRDHHHHPDRYERYGPVVYETDYYYGSGSNNSGYGTGYGRPVDSGYESTRYYSTTPHTRSIDSGYRSRGYTRAPVEESYFERSLAPTRTTSRSLSGVDVAVDLSETDKEWHVHAELPGVDKKDVHVTCDDGRLTISGERARSKEVEGRKYHRSERTYGSFSRTLTLPAHVDNKDVKANFSNGVLEVSITKPADYNQRVQNRRISID